MEESSCMQVPPAVPAPALAALAAPPAGTRHSHLLHTLSPHLQRRLPSQRLVCWNIGQQGVPPHPPNWCSSSQRSTVALQQQPLKLLSIPIHTPSQERGHADSQELSPVSLSSYQLSILPASRIISLSEFLWLIIWPVCLPFLRNRWNGPALQSLWGHRIWFPLWSACMRRLQGKPLIRKMTWNQSVLLHFLCTSFMW